MTRLIALSIVFMACSCARTAQPQEPLSSRASGSGLAAGSGPAAGSAPARPAPASAGALRAEPFGGERWGFVEASSASGRLVVLRRFSGDEPPSFGHHGESMGQQPELTVFDRVSGEERAIDELIEIEPARRWLLVLDDEQLWLVDGVAGVWEALDDADMSPDGNACLAPRQAAFSGKGKRVAWVRRGAVSLVVRDLESGDKWAIPASGRLWRGWPDDEGRGAVVAEVAAGTTDWPQQKTSCACRWCNRFAMSVGYYGWAGPAFKLEHVSADGKRGEGTPPESEGEWHGKTDSGCKLTATSARDGLDRGPWQWTCQ